VHTMYARRSENVAVVGLEFSTRTRLWTQSDLRNPLQKFEDE